MKFICAFDSFKGCISALEACRSAREAVLSCQPDAEVICLPMSDGGEGMTECMASCVKGKWREVPVHGPLMERVMARYYITEELTAYMEMASACGLSLVPPEKRNPMLTTTWGVGELLLDAQRQGCRHVVMGIGGSATCDGGRGMVECLEGHLPLSLSVTVASDVQNPLSGPQGAAHVFGPQKGATPEQVLQLDDRLAHFAQQTVERGLATPSLMHHPGAGAAGGLGYALMAYLDASLVSGIDLMLRHAQFDRHLSPQCIILTGEGCSDRQTLMGKVPHGILRHVPAHVPVWLISGGIADQDQLLQAGFSLVCSINEHDSRPLNTLMQSEIALSNLRQTIRQLLHRYRFQ